MPVMRLLTRSRALALAAALPALVLLSVHFPPSADWPEHVMAMSVLRGLLLQTPDATTYFEANLATSPYLAYHLTGALISVVTGAEWANRLLLLGVAIAFPLSLRRVLAEYGSDTRLAWFGVLPFFSRALSIGFLPYLASVPLGLWLAALVLHYARRDRKGAVTLRRTLLRNAGLALLGTALFYSHISSFSIFAPTACLSAVAVQWAGKRTLQERALGILRSTAWALFPLLAAVRFFLVGRLSATPGTGLDDAPSTAMSLERSLLALPLWIFDNYRHGYDDGVAACYWVAFLACAIYTGAQSWRGRGRLSLLRSIPMVVAMVVYLATPFRVGAAAFLNVRLAPIVLLLTLVPLRSIPKRWFTRAVAAIGVAGGLVFGISAQDCARREGAGLETILRAVSASARVVSLNFDRAAPSCTYVRPYLYPGSYSVAKSGGTAGFSFATLPHWSVHHRAQAAPPKHAPFWVFAPCTFRNSRDGEFYDHVIVRGGLDPFVQRPRGPVFDEVAREGSYVLFRKVPGASWTGPDASPCARLRPAAPPSESGSTAPYTGATSEGL
jgi:hypothetical protein